MNQRLCTRQRVPKGIAGKSRIMDEDQKHALNTVISGHNLLLTGQAGTGKSYVVQNIIRRLMNKNVSVTASTGLGKGSVRKPRLKLSRVICVN